MTNTDIGTNTSLSDFDNEMKKYWEMFDKTVDEIIKDKMSDFNTRMNDAHKELDDKMASITNLSPVEINIILNTCDDSSTINLNEENAK